MSGIQVRSAYGKLENPNTNSKDLKDYRFVTGQAIGSNRRAIDMFPVGVYEVTASVAVESGSTNNLVKITGHSAKVGDLVRILTSANSINEFEVFVDKIVDADHFELASILSADLAAGDTVGIFRPVANKLSSDGTTLAQTVQTPIKFKRNGVDTEVLEDTATPANNRPLPVKLTGFTGDITVTAQQLNVKLSDTDDKVALGDGAGNTIGVSGNPLFASDTANNTQLVAVNAELDAIKLDTANLSAIKTAVELVDDTIATNGGPSLAKFQTVGGHTGTTSHAWHVDNAGLGRVDVRASVLPTGAATEAKQDTGNTSLSNIDTKTPALVGGRTPVDGSGVTQPISALSLPLPTGAATAANQATSNSSLSNIDSDLGAPADAAVTNPASSASVIAALKGLLTLITSSNTKLDTLIDDGSPAFDTTQTQAISASVVTFTPPAGAKRMVIQNSLEAGSPVRFTGNSQTPTASVGFFLNPGQSTSDIPAGIVKVARTDAGADGDVTIAYFV